MAPLSKGFGFAPKPTGLETANLNSVVVDGHPTNDEDRDFVSVVVDNERVGDFGLALGVFQ